MSLKITQDHTGSHKITQYHTRSHKIEQDHIRSHKITQDHTMSLKITQDHTWSHKITQDHTRSHKITQDHTKSNKILKISINLFVEAHVLCVFLQKGVHTCSASLNLNRSTKIFAPTHHRPYTELNYIWLYKPHLKPRLHNYSFPPVRKILDWWPHRSFNQKAQPCIAANSPSCLASPKYFWA